MTKKTVKRYSEALKLQAVSEFEQGASISDLHKKYGAAEVTIRQWVSKYAKDGFRHELVRIQTAQEASRVRELEQQVQDLEKALAKMTLEKIKLESILDVFGISDEDVKKNAVPSSKQWPQGSDSSSDTP
jgi:transposase-like protein